jgi:FixJ family two-component response regulator
MTTHPGGVGVGLANDVQGGPNPPLGAYMAGLVLLVNANGEVLERTERNLTCAGFSVAAVTSFDEGKRLLEAIEPDMLIADVRLGAFNGLHLAVRSHVDRPERPVFITNPSPDPIVEREAARCSARFIAYPADNPDLVREVQSAFDAVHNHESVSRRWPRKQVAGAIDAEAATTKAQILDVSYGGLKLAFTDAHELPMAFDVSLPQAGVTVRVHPVWTSQLAGDGFWCGAEISGDATQGWRSFVDSVS